MILINQFCAMNTRFVFISFLMLFTFNVKAQDQKPNIILIVTHDIGQHIGCYGIETVQTPHIDRLAEKGIRFANYYSTSSVCTPGRASMLTGRYPQSNGLMGLTHAPWWWRLNEGEIHLAEWLKNNGYETYLIGLQHVTQESVEKLGYQHRLSSKNNAEETASASVGLIKNRSSQDQPFFAKIGFFENHRPFDDWKDTSQGVFVPPYLANTRVIKSDLADFQGTICYFDRQVGKILNAFYESDIQDNTLVIFTSEHGIPYPGAKWSVRKAGIEIPLIMYQPNTIFSGGKKYLEIMSNVDLLPTLFDHLQLAIPDRFEGVSFYNYLNEKTQEEPRQMAFSQYTPDMKRDNISRSVITRQYHLIRYFDQGRTVVYPVDVNPVKFAAHQERAATKGTRPFYQLYDIQQDPYELNDLSKNTELQQVAADLSAELLEWMRKVDDPLLNGPFRSPYYNKALEDFTK